MAVAVYISITRVMDHVHHPSDVICGALLGIAVSTLCTSFILRHYFSGGEVNPISTYEVKNLESEKEDCKI